SETERHGSVLHQLRLREGRVAKPIGLTQVEPSILDYGFIEHKGISPIRQDEILLRVCADRACAELESLRANPGRETEGGQENPRLTLDAVLAIPEREHNLVLSIYQESIRARATYECIAPQPPSEPVVPQPSIERVIPCVSIEGIVTTFSVE